MYSLAPDKLTRPLIETKYYPPTRFNLAETPVPQLCHNTVTEQLCTNSTYEPMLLVDLSSRPHMMDTVHLQFIPNS